MVQRKTWQARQFKIFESVRYFRIESGRLIRNRIESRSFAGPYIESYQINSAPLNADYMPHALLSQLTRATAWD